MSWIQSQIQKKDGLLTHPPPISPLYSSPSFSSPYSSYYQKDSTPSSSGTRINPTVLFIIVFLVLIIFISGLLHLLVRFFIKQSSSSSAIQSNRFQEMSSSDALQGQLQELFNLHDSGLDQAFIDALPVFLYKDIMGLKDPFDCAVCLCGFSEQDKLRLLPMCNHAFHIFCIDTWLLSHSTCPLCRGALFTPGLSIENPILNFEDSREEDGLPANGEDGFSSGPKPVEMEMILDEKRVLSVRLGKFRRVIDGRKGEEGEAESSSSNLDARRCYSMGSLQYVVGESNLQVEIFGGHNRNSSVHGDLEGKKFSVSKGESFSVSKIWLWSKKENLPSSSDTPLDTSLNV